MSIVPFVGRLKSTAELPDQKRGTNRSQLLNLPCEERRQFATWFYEPEKEILEVQVPEDSEAALRSRQQIKVATSLGLLPRDGVARSLQIPADMRLTRALSLGQNLRANLLPLLVDGS